MFRAAPQVKCQPLYSKNFIHRCFCGMTFASSKRVHKRYATSSLAMVTQRPFNRRQWLKSTFAGVAGLALAREFAVTPALAQHEKERSAKREELVRISGNENPFGPSQAAVMAMMQNVERSFRYAHT